MGEHTYIHRSSLVSPLLPLPSPSPHRRTELPPRIQLSWPAHGVQVEICKWAPLVTIHGRPESMAITL